MEPLPEGVGLRHDRDLGQQIQLRLAGIQPASVINARDGLDYPFTDAEMQEYLKLFDE